MGKAGKGYRKPGRKHAFSKKDWIWTSVLAVAVITAVVILALVIRSDDFLRTENGKLQMEPNWLIANYSKTSTPQYYQIGSVGEIPGFTLGDESAYSATKYLHAQDENADAQLIYISGAASDYAEMAKYLSSKAAQLAGVDDVFNAVLMRGDMLGDVVFYGKGAGKLPTASAVVADVIDALKEGVKIHDSLFWTEAEKPAGQLRDTGV